MAEDKKSAGTDCSALTLNQQHAGGEEEGLVDEAMCLNCIPISVA